MEDTKIEMYISKTDMDAIFSEARIISSIYELSSNSEIQKYFMIKINEALSAIQKDLHNKCKPYDL